jgi:hypothetical protein
LEGVIKVGEGVEKGTTEMSAEAEWLGGEEGVEGLPVEGEEEEEEFPFEVGVPEEEEVGEEEEAE